MSIAQQKQKRTNRQKDTISIGSDLWFTFSVELVSILGKIWIGFAHRFFDFRNFEFSPIGFCGFECFFCGGHLICCSFLNVREQAF